MPIHDWTKVGPGAVHDFHVGWVGRLKCVLNEELLPRPYYAIAEPASPGPTRADPYVRKARRIAIRSAVEGDRVVAVIEIVPSGNKTPRSRRERFVGKSVAFLEEGIHLAFVDIHPPTPLVPHGFHAAIAAELGRKATPAAPDRPLSAVSYQVLEAGTVRAHFVPLKVGDRLPELAVFLSPHEFVRLPLEATYEDAFRTVPWKYREALAGA